MSASNDIGIRQELEENLERLAAMRFLYSRAKFVRGTNALVATLLALASPITTLFWPKASPVLALVSLLWALTEMVLLDGVEEKNRQAAALIQEEFDTHVFALPWNDALGTRPTMEVVVDAGKSGKGDPEIKRWYPDVTRLPHSLAVLACQRGGLSWDQRVRDLYQDFLRALALGLAVVAVVSAMAAKQSIADALINIALPLLPAFQHAVRTGKAHRRVVAEQERLLEEIDSNWREVLASGKVLPETNLRRVQDRLLVLRRDHPPLPDLVYRLLRSRFESTMHEATQRLVDDAVRRLGH